jgi:hypothetical protein
LSIIGGVQKLDLIAAICVAEARQLTEFAPIFNVDVSHERFLSKFLAYALEVPKLTPVMRQALKNLKVNLGICDKQISGLLGILHNVFKELNINSHYGSLIENRMTGFKRELLDFETFITEEITYLENVVYKDQYLIESIGGETVVPEM